MITITQTINLYKFEELSEKAKANALTDWQKTDYPWSRWNEATLDKFVEHFDFIASTNWDYGCCYRYAECEIDTPYNYEEDLENITGTKLYTFIQNYMDKFKEYKTYTLHGENIYTAKKKHTSKIQWEYSNNCQLTGYYLDCEIMQPIFDYLENFPKNEHVTLGELMNECLACWVSYADSDYDNYYSMEYLEERATENNEYYYENGELYGELTESEVA